MPGLIVGQELARALRLVVGDRVTVVSPRGDLGPTGPIPEPGPSESRASSIAACTSTT